MPSERETTYPDPLIMELREAHQSTMIILHGRGSNAVDFSQSFLATPTPSGKTIAELFPKTRFVFPTASRRRALAFNRSQITQWFDHWSHDRPLERQHVQIEGLRQTTAFLHGLIKAEAALLGGDYGRLAVGGISNGCAASLIALLLWEGPPLAGMFGMCGYLPFVELMQEIATGAPADATGEEGDDPFSASEPGSGNTADTPAGEAIAALREMLDIPTTASEASTVYSTTPVFLGHGNADDKVYLHLGEQARDCLGDLGIPVQWREYNGLRHWFSEQMLEDVVQSLKGKLAREHT